MVAGPAVGVRVIDAVGTVKLTEAELIPSVASIKYVPGTTSGTVSVLFVIEPVPPDVMFASETPLNLTLTGEVTLKFVALKTKLEPGVKLEPPEGAATLIAGAETVKVAVFELPPVVKSITITLYAPATLSGTVVEIPVIAVKLPVASAAALHNRDPPK